MKDFMIFNKQSVLKRKVGDMLPALQIEIHEDTTYPFTALDLTDSTVTLTMIKKKATTPKIDEQPFVATDESLGQYSFSFLTAHVDEAGVYDCYVQLTDASSNVQTIGLPFEITIEKVV